MADIMLRNIDLMSHITTRNAPNASKQVIPQITKFTKLLWDDLPLLGFTVTKLRQQSLPRCVMIIIQVAYQFTAVPGTAPWPIVTIRDGAVATNSPLTAVNGLEMIPGDTISWSLEDSEVQKETFIDPTEIYAFLNAVLAVRLHICYGVLQ